MVDCSPVDAADAGATCWVKLLASSAHINANIILVQILAGIAVRLNNALPQNQLIAGAIALNAKSKRIGSNAASWQGKALAVDAFLLRTTLSYLLTVSCVIHIES